MVDGISIGRTDYMIGAASKHELEKEVLHVLRRLDGDCDVEALDHKVEEE